MAKNNILLRSKIKKVRALLQADQRAEAGVLLEQILWCRWYNPGEN